MWPTDVEPGEYLVVEEGILVALAGGDLLLLPSFEVVSAADAEVRFTLFDGTVHPANPTWLGVARLVAALHRARGADQGQELLVATMYAGGEMLRFAGRTGASATMFETAMHEAYDIHLTISPQVARLAGKTLH